MSYSSWDKECLIDVSPVATGIPAGGAVDLHDSGKIKDEFAIMVKGVGAAPTTLAGQLEGSLDGVNYTLLQAFTQANDGAIQWVNLKPVRYFRVNITSLTLGSATAVRCMVIAG